MDADADAWIIAVNAFESTLAGPDTVGAGW